MAGLRRFMGPWGMGMACVLLPNYVRTTPTPRAVAR